MRKNPVRQLGLIRVNKSYLGRPLEEEISAMMVKKEPIKGISPMYYTERKNGVHAEYDIRTDRWELAKKASNVINRNAIAKRENIGKAENKEDIA